MSSNTMLQEFLSSPDPDKTIIAHLRQLVDSRRADFTRDGPANPWTPGTRVKLLLGCYGGGGNIGADIRLVETMRQLRHIVGTENLDLGMLVPGYPLTGEDYADVRQEIIQDYFPTFLADRCLDYHGVVAAEGSLFKSNLSDSYSAMITAGLGLASAEDKLSVAYGVEAGRMSADLTDFVQHTCGNSRIICRNEASRKELESLGISATAGADTAWTFEPSSPDRARELVRSAWWDGESPILIVCPMNPYWWPIRADLKMAYELETAGMHRDVHFGSVFFHYDSEEARSKYSAYLDSLANATNAFLQSHPDYFPIVVGMERLDARACEDLSARLGSGVARFVSGDFDMYDVVAILRLARVLVSSRFHAIVTAMPAGVPAVGISWDERIGNLLGSSERVIGTDEPGLQELLLRQMLDIDRHHEEAVAKAKATAATEVQKMGEMGIALALEFDRHFPELERPTLPGTWAGHLPRLSPTLEALVGAYV